MVTLFAVVISRGADNGKAAPAIPTAICEFPIAKPEPVADNPKHHHRP